MREWKRDRPLGLIDDLIDGLIWLARTPRRKRDQRRKKAGLCYYCGYDVRGTSGRCPECGRYPLFRRHAQPDWPEIQVDSDAPADADAEAK